MHLFRSAMENIGISDEQEKVELKRKIWLLASIVTILLPAIFPVLIKLSEANFDLTQAVSTFSISQVFIALFCLLSASYIEYLCHPKQTRQKGEETLGLIGLIFIILMLTVVYMVNNKCPLHVSIPLALIAYLVIYKYCMRIIVFLSTNIEEAT